jgi:hypothetical protein
VGELVHEACDRADFHRVLTTQLLLVRRLA